MVLSSACSFFPRLLSGTLVYLSLSPMLTSVLRWDPHILLCFGGVWVEGDGGWGCVCIYTYMAVCLLSFLFVCLDRLNWTELKCSEELSTYLPTYLSYS